MAEIHLGGELNTCGVRPSLGYWLAVAAVGIVIAGLVALMIALR